MQIQFLGCGDAFGSGGRFNTCFMVDWRDGRFLIDCGATSLVAMKQQGVEPNDIDAILVTHLHGDHFGGLPFYLLDARLVSRRRRPLTLAGPPGLRRRLDAAMEVLYPGSSRKTGDFDLDVRELDPGRRHDIGGVGVTPYLVNHSCGAPPFALRVECEGRILCYTGDTAWSDSLIAAGRDADLMIAEANFFETPGKGHMDYRTLESRVPDIRPKRLILTHMGEDMLARAGDLAFETAEDGKIITL